ncbi:MAG: hypothetical protein WBD91_03300, partial [Acidobacteriaceae bacterium]
MRRADNPGPLGMADLYEVASTSNPTVDPKASLAAAPEAAHPPSPSIRILFAVCAITLLVQGVLVLLDAQAVATSNVLIALEFLFATAGCLGSTSRQNAETRALWILVAFGFLLSIAGQILDTYDLVMKVPQAAASLPDYLFLVYGIPILLAISFTDDEADLRVLFWLDGAQGIVAAILVYFQIFSTLPWTGHTTSISATSLMYVYDVENLILSGAVTLRLFGRPAPAKRRLYIAMSIYLWCYAVVALILNYLELERSLAQGLQDVLWGTPCLLLLAALLFLPDEMAAGDQVNEVPNRSVA